MIGNQKNLASRDGDDVDDCPASGHDRNFSEEIPGRQRPELVLVAPVVDSRVLGLSVEENEKIMVFLSEFNDRFIGFEGGDARTGDKTFKFVAGKTGEEFHTIGEEVE